MQTEPTPSALVDRDGFGPRTPEELETEYQRFLATNPVVRACDGFRTAGELSEVAALKYAVIILCRQNGLFMTRELKRMQESTEIAAGLSHPGGRILTMPPPPADPYAAWCEAHGCSHGHCPDGNCEHPQPLVHNGTLVCGRCLVKFGDVNVMVPCLPENCRD